MRFHNRFFRALHEYHHAHHHSHHHGHGHHEFDHHRRDDHGSWFGDDSEQDVRHAGRGGPFGGRHGGGGFFGEWNEMRGGGRRGGGRMFGHGDLKLLLLALIEQQPRHGYELIRTIEEMFHGNYSPSPGAIYPTLTMLEELGHVAIESEQGGRKLYAITPLGIEFLNENRDAVEAMTARTEQSARMAARMSMPENVHRAMHALKHALLMRGVDWDKAEAQRVAAILEQAASDIATKRSRD